MRQWPLRVAELANAPDSKSSGRDREGSCTRAAVEPRAGLKCCLPFVDNRPYSSVLYTLKGGDVVCKLLQLRVFGFGLFQDGNVLVGVLPQSKEILIRGAGFGSISLQRESTGHPQTS